MANKSGAYFDAKLGKMVFPAAEVKPEAEKGKGRKRNANSTWLEFPNDLLKRMLALDVAQGFNPDVNKYGEKHETEKGKQAYITSTLRVQAIAYVTNAVDVAEKSAEQPSKNQGKKQ